MLKKQKHFSFLDCCPVGICILQNKIIVYVNPFLQKLLGKVRIIGENILEYIVEDDHHRVNPILERLEAVENLEVRSLTSRGIRWVTLNISPISFQGMPSIIIGVLDITDRKLVEKEIRYLSFRDKLTGLFNRAYFQEELERLNTKRQLPLSVIMADVNGLKLINDGFGHLKGDHLLIKAAEVIKKACRNEDIVARWGGDEFIVLLPSTGKKSARLISSRIKESCFQTKDEPIKVSISIGFSTKETEKEDIYYILKEAEENMYHNKLKEARIFRDNIISTFRKKLHTKTNETIEHQERIKTFATKIGQALNLSERQIDDLSLLSSYHDIGKTAIPEEILNKKGNLTEEEWKIVKRHSEVGYRIVQSLPELSHIAEGILYHHERWDGKGYPHGLMGEDIPILARVIAIADAYSVMIDGMRYKEAVSKEGAILEIANCAGTQFDPDIAKSFVKLIDENKFV